MVCKEICEGVNFFCVDEGDEAEEKAESVDHEHHVSRCAVFVLVKHAALPLPRERVKHEEEHEQHYAAQSSRPRFWPPNRIQAKVHIFGGHHEESDSKSDQKCHRIVVRRISFVAVVNSKNSYLTGKG
jgi:hypothetical protein